MSIIRESDLQEIPRDGVDGEYSFKVNLEGDMEALSDHLIHYERSGQAAPLIELDDYYISSGEPVALFGPLENSREEILDFYNSGKAYPFDFYDIVLTDNGYYLFTSLKTSSNGSKYAPASLWDYYTEAVADRAEYFVDEVSGAIGTPSEVVEGVKSVGKKLLWAVSIAVVVRLVAPSIIGSLKG